MAIASISSRVTGIEYQRFNTSKKKPVGQGSIEAAGYPVIEPEWRSAGLATELYSLPLSTHLQQQQDPSPLVLQKIPMKTGSAIQAYQSMANYVHLDHLSFIFGIDISI